MMMVRENRDIKALLLKFMVTLILSLAGFLLLSPQNQKGPIPPRPP
jgi:hypothetical protein